MSVYKIFILLVFNRECMERNAMTSFPILSSFKCFSRYFQTRITTTKVLKFSNLHSLNLNNLQKRRYCSQRHMFFFCIQKTNASVLNIFVWPIMPVCHIYFEVNPIFWNAIIEIVLQEYTCVYIQYQNDQFFLPFSVNCSQVAMFQIMPALCPHGQGEGLVNQMWTGLDRGRGGPKNSQICADILYG